MKHFERIYIILSFLLLLQFDSLSVPLEYNLTQFGYWNDRNGGKQIFWAGPATSQHTCQCGIMNNCVERNFKCNADSLAPIELFDEGKYFIYLMNTIGLIIKYVCCDAFKYFFFYFLKLDCQIETIC